MGDQLACLQLVGKIWGGNRQANQKRDACRSGFENGSGLQPTPSFIKTGGGWKRRRRPAEGDVRRWGTFADGGAPRGERPAVSAGRLGVSAGRGLYLKWPFLAVAKWAHGRVPHTGLRRTSRILKVFQPMWFFYHCRDVFWEICVGKQLQTIVAYIVVHFFKKNSILLCI
jgi:hypothetical protein